MQQVGTSITAEALHHFIRFQHLTPDELQTLAGQLHVETARAGQCLFCAGYNAPREFFLLSGVLKLITTNGRSHLIDANSEEARQPIAKLRPSRYSAVAKTAVEYFLFDVGHTRSTARVARASYTPWVATDVAEITPAAVLRAHADYRQRR